VVSAALALGALGLTSSDLRDGALPLRGDAFASADVRERKRVRPSPPPVLPSSAQMQRAWRYARERGGTVSFAVVDTEGRILARDGARLYPSASVVKAMLLVAELRRLDDQGLALDEGTAGLLHAMVTWSDNDAADAVYARVGDAGLLAVAEAAGLRHFWVGGHWGNAQVAAGDMARLFWRMRALLPRRHRAAGLELLASVVPSQSWGLPKAARRGGWRVYFKGGWRETGSGELVHQAGLLADGRRRLSVAVLTDAQPSQLHAIHTVRGIANRLLAPGGR
jgi:Beta-lactamase enzyme family